MPRSHLRVSIGSVSPNYFVEQVGLEPTVSCVQGRCFSQLSYCPKVFPALPCALYFGSDCSDDEFESSRRECLCCTDGGSRTHKLRCLRPLPIPVRLRPHIGEDEGSRTPMPLRALVSQTSLYTIPAHPRNLMIKYSDQKSITKSYY